MRTDYISRQALLTAIQKAYVDTDGGEDRQKVYINVGLTMALNLVQDAPSVQPKTDILDKIRAEIEQTFLDDGAMQEYTVERCLEIIDKYKEG